MNGSPRSSTNGDRLGVRVERWLHEFWPDLVNYIGSVFLAASGVVGILFPDPREDTPAMSGSSPSPSPTASGGEVTAAEGFSTAAWWTLGLLIVGAALILVGFLGLQAKRTTLLRASERANTAESDLREHSLGVEAMLRAMQADLLTQLGIYRDDTRGSIYALDGDSFVRLARVSTNPVLKAGGRPAYPADQGVIGLAWRKGEATLTNLPDDRGDWEAKMSEYGIPPEVARDLQMQSRSIVAMRVDGPAPEHEPLAIVVLESEAKRGVHGKTIDSTRGLGSWKTLTSAVANLRDTINTVARVKHLSDDTGAQPTVAA